jgi:hypothetical protein
MKHVHEYYFGAFKKGFVSDSVLLLHVTKSWSELAGRPIVPFSKFDGLSMAFNIITLT